MAGKKKLNILEGVFPITIQELRGPCGNSWPSVQYKGSVQLRLCGAYDYLGHSLVLEVRISRPATGLPPGIQRNSVTPGNESGYGIYQVCAKITIQFPGQLYK